MEDKKESTTKPTKRTKRCLENDISWKTVGTIVFWAIILYILYRMIRMELLHLGCFIQRQQECTSPFYRVAPQPGDDVVTLLQRVENGIRQPEEIVWWRRNLTISIFISFFLALIYTKQWPDVVPFVFGTLVVYVILASLTNWYDMHIWYRVREQQMRTVQQLRFELSIDKESGAKGVYGPPNTTGVEYVSNDIVV
jgi:hypothetical protein